jgi:hypothetical protein
MSAWIAPARIATLLRTELDADEYMVEFIAHVQGLAEVEVGPQEVPVSAGLASTFAEIVTRKYQATLDAETNPTGVSQESIGGYSWSRYSVVGMMLTDAEKKALRKAAGVSGMWVQPITRGDRLETAGLVDVTYPGGLPVEWFDPSELP